MRKRRAAPAARCRQRREEVLLRAVLAAQGHGAVIAGKAHKRLTVEQTPVFCAVVGREAAIAEAKPAFEGKDSLQTVAEVFRTPDAPTALLNTAARLLPVRAILDIACVGNSGI